jgi:cation diffusion facilitator CzcD-associated flavoprotein CzcO
MASPAFVPSVAQSSAAPRKNESVRAPRHGGPDLDTVPHSKVAILGTGFGGLGMAIRLLQSGERDIALFEKADEVGGTWRDNTYPGCQCDVASNMYSFSFAPNPKWSRTFAWQGEIFAYLRDCADRFGVRPFIRFQHEVLDARWLPAEQRWLLQTNRGDYTADVLVSGHGFLSAPSVPEIPGLARFRGTMFHSAAWRHDYDLAGKRVAVIGTGATAIQVVPAIQPKVAQLTLFQRTPAWIVPRLDYEFSERKQWWFEHVPLTQKLDRLRIYLGRELVVLAMRKPELMAKHGERMARQHLRSQVPDRELRRKLRPNYAMGCKRILLSNDYYPALAQPNATVVTEGIAEVTETGIVTSDGQRHEVDAIILCTGFKVTDHPFMDHVFGADGRSLGEVWRAGSSSYLGTTMTGFPNFFLLTGPYTGLGHNSIIYMLESQFTYILGALAELDKRGGGALDVKHEAMDAFGEEMQAQLQGTVWTSGCQSWYQDSGGRLTSVWPTFTWRFRKRTRRFDPAAYGFEEKRAGAAQTRAAAG